MAEEDERERQRERLLYDKQMEVFQAKLSYMVKKQEYEFMSEYSYIVKARKMMRGRMTAPPETDNVTQNGTFISDLAKIEQLRVTAHNCWVVTTNEITALRRLISRLEAGEEPTETNVSTFGSPRNAIHGRARLPSSFTSGNGSPGGKGVPHMSVNRGCTSATATATATRNKKHMRSNPGDKDDQREEGFKIARKDLPAMEDEDDVEDMDGGISDSEIANIPDKNEEKDDQSSHVDGA